MRESLDTTSSGGRLVFHVFASIAEFERDVIRGRTVAGLEAARATVRKTLRGCSRPWRTRPGAAKLRRAGL